MANPLSLLRQYYMDKKEIIERDNQIIFGDLAWPKNVSTSFRKTVKKKHLTHGKSGNYYTLECLLFFLNNSDILHSVYCEEAALNLLDAVCRNCLLILQESIQSSQTLRRFGYRNICIPCGSSMLRAHQTHSVPADSAERNIILQWIPPHQAANIPAVFRPDRKKILMYLNGETETSENIDKDAPVEQPTQLKRTHDSEGAEELPVKKSRTEETQEEAVEDLLDAALEALGANEKSVTVKK